MSHMADQRLIMIRFEINLFLSPLQPSICHVGAIYWKQPAICDTVTLIYPLTYIKTSLFFKGQMPQWLF